MMESFVDADAYRSVVIKWRITWTILRDELSILLTS